VQINPDDGKVKAVEYIQYAPEVGKIAQNTVSAKIFVLAAHGIETAKILLMSKSTQYPQGVANSSGLVGKNLMDHPVLLVWGELPEPVFPFRGPLSTAGIENLRDGDFRKERAAFRIEIGNEGWNWPTGSPDTNVKNLVDKNVFGKELKEALANTLTRQMRLGFLIEQDPVESSWTAPSENPNEVDALGIPRPVIHYDFGDYTKRGFVAALKTAEMLFQQMGIATLHRNTDPKNTGYFEYDGIPFTFEGAGHVMGTYRMGEKPSNSVVNKDQRSWDHENLFLVGSGTFPTVATANPTLTLAALCLRTAEIIKQQC
jgi:choline dehydrogenase-like flavoprotein